MFVAPTEPPPFSELGVVTSLPEEYGADFYWESELGKVGIQRKVFPGDFLSSIHDGRLNREYSQMQSLDIRVLLLEGRGRWSSSGALIESYGRQESRRLWTLEQQRNYLASVQIFKGVTIQQSENKDDTTKFLLSFKNWTMKKEHLGLERRPAAQADSFWADISNRDFQRYLLQSFPIIGPKLAEAILDELGMIFHLDVTYEQLLTVRGIGPGRAKKIMDVFHKLEPQ